MAIHIEWVGFAEGSALDSRQAVTLVGFNQCLVSPEELPFKWQSQIIVIAKEAQDSPAESASGFVTVTIKDPGGGVIASISNFVNATRKHPDVPASVIMAVMVGLDVAEHGAFEVEATARETQDGPVTSKQSQTLYVIAKLTQ